MVDALYKDVLDKGFWSYSQEAKPGVQIERDTFILVYEELQLVARVWRSESTKA